LAPDVGWASISRGSAPLALALEDIEARQPLFRQKDSNHLLSFHRYVRWVSSGSDEIGPFSYSKTCLGITFSVFNPKKWLGTFSKAMAIEKMDTCADRCLIIIVTFALFRQSASSGWVGDSEEE
jgi:hypothetical protein